MSTKKPRDGSVLRKGAVPGLDKRQARRWRRCGGFTKRINGKIVWVVPAAWGWGSE